MGHRDLYKLARLRLRQSTINEYKRDVGYFKTWLKRKKYRPGTNPDEVDRLLTQYAVEQYSKADGHGLRAIERAKAGLVFYIPELKNKLPLTDLSIQGWRRVAPAKPHECMPEEIAYLLAHDIFLAGHPDIATGVLLALDCYLRIGDVCTLRESDIIPTGKDRSPFAVAVALDKTKTGQMQSALVRPPFLGKMLLRVKEQRITLEGPGAKLISVSANTIRSVMKKSLKKLGIHQRLTFHSLRYGGATRDTLNNSLTPEGIMHRGRWRSKKSMAGYVKPAFYLRNLGHLTSSQLKKARKLLKNPYKYFSVPPPPEVGGLEDSTQRVPPPLDQAALSGFPNL